MKWFLPLRFALFVLLLLLGLSGAELVTAQEAPIPRLEGHVTDTARVLSDSARVELENLLSDFEQKKGAQVVVVTVPTTHPETVEQYALRVGEQWRVGRAKVDDGVILLVAKNDRKVRIEVAYGLEGAIPDAIANRIIDQYIVPRFRAGDFDGGIREGVEAILHRVQGEELPLPQRAESLPPLVFLVVIVVFILIITLSVAGAQPGTVYSSRGYRRSGGFGGGSFGGGGGFGGGFSGGGGRFGGGGASGSW